MIKKLLNFFIILITSGILFHRSTLIGAFCGLWVYFGSQTDESAFHRMLTPDLFIFMAAFLILFRLLFKKMNKADGTPDFHGMGICFLGDFAWAVLAMFCTVQLFMMLSFSDDYLPKEQDPEAMMMQQLQNKPMPQIPHKYMNMN